ncbi:MAG: hypothetical protein WD851_18520 [Pirellulales bacterium]
MSTRAYDEIIDLIAAGGGPSAVAEFEPSQAAREWVWGLIAQEKSTGLTAEEKLELDQYMQIEHLMRLAKARAKIRLANE